jgi:hypothetical protein
MVTNNAPVFKTILTDNEHSSRVQANISDAFRSTFASLNQTNSNISALSSLISGISATNVLIQTRSGHIQTGYGVNPDTRSITAASGEYLLYLALVPVSDIVSLQVTDPTAGSFYTMETTLIPGIIFPGQSVTLSTTPGGQGDLWFVGFQSTAIG